jgi:hypothetical protein
LVFEMYRLKYPEYRSLAQKGKPVSLAQITRSLAAILLFAIVVLPSAAIEYEPGEMEAEARFELGLGGPWIMSEMHPELYGDVEDTTWFPDSEFSPYSEYFSIASPGGMEVERYYASGLPEIYAGGSVGQLLASSAYQLAQAGENAFWILGAGSCTGYALVPQGAYLRLLAYSPGGGLAYFYDIKPQSGMAQTQYYLYPGYSQVTFRADEVGRSVLLFRAGGRLSNSVVVDVKSGSWPIPVPVAGTEPTGYGYARLTLTSATLRGYSVWVDGSYVGADGWGDDLLDGIYSFYISGNERHNVKVYGSGRTCISTDYYESGNNYTIELVC